MFTFLNDAFLAAADAALSVNDLAIQRGYGIFDFFKTVGGKPIFLDDHLDRFFHSAARMRLDIGKSRGELNAIITELQRLNGLPDSGIRITLTGGISADSVSLGRPNLILTQIPLAPPSKDCVPPVRLITYPHQRQLPDVKTIDYLMAIHLQPHIRDRGASDVLYHHNGIITECPRCNFFVVTADNRLVTAARNILEGITRKHILELASTTGFAADAGLAARAEERDIHLDELRTAREAFITSTSRHIVPVSHIDDQAIGMAAGRNDPGHSAASQPGAVAQRLNALLYQLVNNPGKFRHFTG